MEPSAEVGDIGLLDVRESLRVHRRPGGEYVIFIEDDSKAKIVMYRWTSVSDTAVEDTWLGYD